MVLHSQRKRRADRDLREGSGEGLWTEEVPIGARISLSTMWHAVEALDRFEGLPESISTHLRINGVWASEHVFSDSIRKNVDSDEVLDLLGAFCVVVSHSPKFESDYPELEQYINVVLEDHRVAFRVIDAEVIPLEADELHREVVVPALRLLIGTKFTKAHSAYLEALKQLPTHPDNAITDAGTALQEALTALGCKGNALGPLIRSARTTGLLAAHDVGLTEGIEKFLHWVSANRNEVGDSHKVSDASREDAWLMVHVVGALIVKLVRASATGQLET